MSVKPRIIEGNEYVSSLEHWELLEDKGLRFTKMRGVYINIPRDIVRHLGLQSRDLITIAIKHHVKRNGEDIELEPEKIELKKPDPTKLYPISYGYSRLFVNGFLESDLTEVEVPREKWVGVHSYVARHKNLKVKICRRNTRHPDKFYCWLEKVE